MSERTFYGWLLTVCGVIFLVAGVSTLADRKQNKVKIGVLILGPILLIRGIIYLSRGDSDPILKTTHVLPPPDQPASVPQPAGDKTDLGPQIGAQPKITICDERGKDYYHLVWFKGSISEFHHTVAPCPSCGHINRVMHAAARPPMPQSASLAVILIGIVSVGIVALGLSAREHSEYYYVAAAATFGLSLVYYAWKRINWCRYDPNSETLESRMTKAQQSSIGLTEFAAIKARKV